MTQLFSRHLKLAMLMPLLALSACSTADSRSGSADSNASNPNSSDAPVTFPANPNGAAPTVAAPLLVAATNPDSSTSAVVQQSVQQLAAQGFPAAAQGIWMQTEDALLANHQGTVPLSAASLTKVATSLAALQTLGPDHQFVTLLSTTGPIRDGVVQGDLIVQGGQDPLFVWEEAIAVGNLLNQLKIRRITGDLVIVGPFYMNFEFDPVKSGTLLRQALNAQTWSGEVEEQYRTLRANTPRPQVEIAGKVRSSAVASPQAKPLLRHKSLPLAELLKKMNQYSNNAMAEAIATSVGGRWAVMQKVIAATGIPPEEISLVNGSGLSPENRISPRAVCAMFRAIDRTLKPHNRTIADIFSVIGQDQGILEARQIPTRAVVKSGSLDAVSALAGALPTRDKGIVWFVIMNGGGANLEGFRASQEKLLRQLVGQWGAVAQSPAPLTSTVPRSAAVSRSEAIAQ